MAMQWSLLKIEGVSTLLGGRMRILMSVLLLGAAVACSSTLGPATLAGTWSKLEMIPENSVTMTLSTSGSTISGSGNWCGEALGCGTLAVSGTIMSGAIHLDIVYSSGLVDHFDGHLNAFNTLDGSERSSVPGQPPQLPHAATYHRSQF
jgi:hypothetical protein